MADTGTDAGGLGGREGVGQDGGVEVPRPRSLDVDADRPSVRARHDGAPGVRQADVQPGDAGDRGPAVLGRAAVGALLHQLERVHRPTGQRRGAVPDELVCCDVGVALGPVAQCAGALSLTGRQQALASGAEHVPGTGEDDERPTIR